MHRPEFLRYAASPLGRITVRVVNYLGKVFMLYMHVGVWLSLVERYVRDVEAAGSNPVTPIR